MIVHKNKTRNEIKMELANRLIGGSVCQSAIHEWYTDEHWVEIVTERIFEKISANLANISIEIEELFDTEAKKIIDYCEQENKTKGDKT